MESGFSFRYNGAPFRSEAQIEKETADGTVYEPEHATH